MSVRSTGTAVFLVGTMLGLAGCVPGTLGGSKTGGAAGADGDALPISAGATDASGADSALTLVARDVEVPDVYKIDDEGLWDGRPSLGGVWVATKNVKDPERVIIRNPANGKSVIGALFRREADNPGPSLQVSSDAADALGMLAGQPAKLSVVALKREEPQAPVTGDTLPADASKVATGEPKISDKAGETAAATGDAVKPAVADPVIAGAAAAIDKAEGKTGDAAAGATDAMAADAVAPDISTEPVAKKRHWWQRKPKEPAAETPLEATLPAAGGAVATAATPVESSALPATDASAPVLTRSYVQIGIFSTAANAQRAADQMKAAGMTATVRKDDSNGKSFWRVIVGPAASVAERDALAGRVKGIGYPDAYPVKQ